MSDKNKSPFGDSLKNEMDDLNNLLDKAITKAVTNRQKVSYTTDVDYEEVRNIRDNGPEKKDKPVNWEKLKDSALEESWSNHEHELETEDTKKVRKVSKKKSTGDDWEDDPY